MTVRQGVLPYLMLVLLSVALFAPGQASLPPLDRDESRYMQSTTQMFEAGNFVDIRFQDQPRYLQPAGIYWLQATSVSLLSAPGDHDAWAYRVPSLIGATIAVFLTAWIGNLLFGAPTAFLAAAPLALSLILASRPMAKIDAVLLPPCWWPRPRWRTISRPTQTEVPIGWRPPSLALGAGLMLKARLFC